MSLKDLRSFDMQMKLTQFIWHGVQSVCFDGEGTHFTCRIFRAYLCGSMSRRPRNNLTICILKRWIFLCRYELPVVISIERWQFGSVDKQFFGKNFKCWRDSELFKAWKSPWEANRQSVRQNSEIITHEPLLPGMGSMITHCWVLQELHRNRISWFSETLLRLQ